MPEELLRLVHATRRVTSEFYVQDISLTMHKGEILALVGRNAAGKSTLASMLNGVCPVDSGNIFFEGQAVNISDECTAVRLGIVTLSQNSRGFENFSVAENILFGNKKYEKKHRVINHREQYRICSECFEMLHIGLNPAARYQDLTAAQKQLASLARAFLADAKLLILDEPSSHFSQRESEVLCHVVKSLKTAGTAILYITHRLDEAVRLGDAVILMEQGKIKEILPKGTVTELDLMQKIEDMPLGNLYAKEPMQPGETLLEIKNLCSGAAEQISLTLHRRELVAVLSSAEGCAEDIYRTLMGTRKYTGAILVKGNEVKLCSPLEADAQHMVAVLDEESERMLQSYNSAGGSRTGRFSRTSARVKEAGDALSRMLSQFTGINQNRPEYTTGGFRQKELLARALARDGEIYIFADATNGMDLRARMAFYVDLNRVLRRGCGVLYFTTDANEALGLADDIFVLDGHTIVFHENTEKVTENSLTKLLKM